MEPFYSVLIIILISIGYCFGVVTKSPCHNYKLLDNRLGQRNVQTRRLSNEPGLSDMFSILNGTWYRFNSDVCNTIPSHQVAMDHCGTHVPIHIDGVHPTGKYIYDVRVISSDPRLRSWSSTIKVKNCYNGTRYYPVYRLVVPIYDGMAYCAGERRTCTCEDSTPPNTFLTKTIVHRLGNLSQHQIQIQHSRPYRVVLAFSSLSGVSVTRGGKITIPSKGATETGVGTIVVRVIDDCNLFTKQTISVLVPISDRTRSGTEDVVIVTTEESKHIIANDNEVFIEDDSLDLRSWLVWLAIATVISVFLIVFMVLIALTLRRRKIYDLDVHYKANMLEDCEEQVLQ